METGNLFRQLRFFLVYYRQRVYFDYQTTRRRKSLRFFVGVKYHNLVYPKSNNRSKSCDNHYMALVHTVCRMSGDWSRRSGQRSWLSLHFMFSLLPLSAFPHCGFDGFRVAVSEWFYRLAPTILGRQHGDRSDEREGARTMSRRRTAKAVRHPSDRVRESGANRLATCAPVGLPHTNERFLRWQKATEKIQRVVGVNRQRMG